ncbi:MAG: hypothetical protein ACRELG_26870 [Gemmataceae bacterium]
MWDSVRRFGAGLVGIAAILALGHQAVFGQQPAPAANPNVYVNPFATTGRFANTAALGQTLNAPASGRLGYSYLSSGAYSPATGVGTLAASYANPSLGYGSLMNSNYNRGGGGGNGYGMSGYGMMGYGMIGTQWMMNPYQGYLTGAASITKAQGQYYLTIQQAKLLRQDAIRSSIQTRRAWLEEAQWERDHMPDPEKIRQKALARELDGDRHSPPLTRIWSARALNSLLRQLITQQGLGARGPNVPLSDEIRDHTNLTVGDSRGNVGLLKDSGNLQWPLPLQKSAFKGARENLNTLMQTALKSAKNSSLPDSSTISDMRAYHEKLKDALDANVDQLTPDEFIEANRYLRLVKSTITALKDPNVIQQFNKNWEVKARNVAELVQFMREKGLWFAQAAPKDEAAYVALYYALASFDAGMQRLTNTGTNGDGDK